MKMSRKQSGQTDAHYSLEGFYVPGAPSARCTPLPKAHRNRKKCLTIALILILAIGSLIWYRSQATARGDAAPPALNTPFSILHPLASLKARDAEQATWSALAAQDPTAMEHELARENVFFRRAATQAREWQVLLLPTPRQLASPLRDALTVTSPFGMRRHPVIGQELEHHGVDLVAEPGTSVKAAERGIVAWEGHKWGYGNCIVIRHGVHLATIYGHLSHIGVHTGQSVRRGEVIGLSGSTGFSTGPHLHFEVRDNGTPVDPLSLLDPGVPVTSSD